MPGGVLDDFAAELARVSAEAERWKALAGTLFGFVQCYDTARDVGPGPEEQHYAVSSLAVLADRLLSDPDGLSAAAEWEGLRERVRELEGRLATAESNAGGIQAMGRLNSQLREQQNALGRALLAAYSMREVVNHASFDLLEQIGSALRAAGFLPHQEPESPALEEKGD